MLSCNAADLMYRIVPLKAWRAFLIRVHFERCPSCRAQLIGEAEARSLFVQEADVRAAGGLWPRVARSLAESANMTAAGSRALAGGRAWRWAAAAVVVTVLAGYWAFRDFRPAGVPSVAAAPASFALEYVRVGGQPADAFIYQPQGSDMVIVWAGKAN